MAKKRASQSHADTPDDAVSAWLFRITRWSRQNTQVVIIAGILLAVAVGAGIYYYNFQSDVRMQAAEEFERIQQTVVGVGDTETALTELQTFLNRYGDTPLAAEARLLLAEAHLHEDAPEQAIEILRPVAADLDRPIGIQGAFLLAAAYEQADRLQEADDTYLRIADEAEFTFQVRNALADAARIRANSGNPEGAAELYRQVLDTYDGTDPDPAGASQRQTYELRLAEAEAAARNS